MILTLPLCSLSAADIPEDVDTSRWNCKNCEFEEGLSGSFSLGLGTVSDESFKFGEYNALYQDGAFPIADAELRYRGEEADYLNLKLQDLALDSRVLEIDGGQQGNYRLMLNYQQLSHAISNSAQTPYRGSGSDTLVLPAGWVDAGATSGMTQLDASLRDLELKTQRNRLEIGAAYIPHSEWETALKVRQEIREGSKRSAGSFFFNSAQLVEPVDYVTNELDVSATYTTREWQSRVAYYASVFTNHNESLSWDNAYNPLTAGADEGQLALPPDNQFHQLQFSTGYQMSRATRFNAELAVGRMEQDEDLLAASLNPNRVVLLPRTSANAQVDTTTLNLQMNSRISEQLNVKAAYRYNDHDNQTPSELFDWITTDTFSAVARTNLPYSFTDNELDLSADYRFSQRTKLSAGYQHKIKQRTNQEVDETSEDSLWGKLSYRSDNDIDWLIKAEHAQRDASGYNLVAQTDPSQSLLMRKYNLADRVREAGSISASFNPNESSTLSLSVDLAQDDYSDSLVGLTESNEIHYNLDSSFILSESTSLHDFAGREVIKSHQAGSQTFSVADWFALNRDTTDSFGVGLKHLLMENRLELGADLVLMHAVGEIRIENAANYPDLETNLETLKLYASYQLRENMTVNAAYWYERYDAKDWALDNIDVDTLSSVIGFGETVPDYSVQALMVSLRYKF